MGDSRKTGNEASSEPKMSRFDEYTDISSVIGMRYLSSRFRFEFRIIWTLVMLVFVGLTIYQLQDRVMWYWENPLSSDLTVIDGEPMKFPKVIVCNKMQVRLSSAIDRYDPAQNSSTVPHDFYELLPALFHKTSDTPHAENILQNSSFLLESLSSLTQKWNSNMETWERVEEIQRLEWLWRLDLTPQILSLLLPLNGPCEVGWYFDRATQSCLWTPKYKLKFQEAEDLCRRRGAHLASIHSTLENTAIQDFVKRAINIDWASKGLIVENSNSASTAQDGSINSWIGLTIPNSTGLGGDLFWTDGTPYDFFNWGPSMTFPSPWMASTVSSSSTGSGFMSIAPFQVTPFAGQDSLVFLAEELCGAGWIFDVSNGKCYRSILQDLTWVDANNKCREMGSELVSIHNDLDLLRIMGHATDQSNGTWPYYGLWTGLTDRDSEGTFTWSDGTPTDYLRWEDFYYRGVRSSQPNDWNHLEDCVVITEKGVMRDFICQVDPSFPYTFPVWFTYSMCIKSAKMAVHPKVTTYMANRLGTDLEDSGCALKKAISLVEQLGNLNLTEWILNTGQSAEELIPSCVVFDQPCKISKTPTQDGVCYMMEPEDENGFFVLQPGADHGLTAVLDLELHERVPGFPHGTAKVFLESAETEAPSSIGGYTVNPGSAVELQIKSEKVLRRHGSKCGERQLNHTETYTKKACLWEALVDELKTKCPCLPIIQPQSTSFYQEPGRKAASEFTCIEDIGGTLCANYGSAACRNSKGYEGTKDTTVLGLPCMNWAESFEHRKAGNHSYCRNIDGSIAPWCYVSLDARKKAGDWNFCFPDCKKLDQEPSTCVDEIEGMMCSYHGYYRCRTHHWTVNHFNKSTTADNRPCLFWSNTTDYEFSDFILNLKVRENICENVDGSGSSWCLALNEEGKIEKYFCYQDCAKLISGQPWTCRNTYQPKTRVSFKNRTCSTYDQVRCFKNAIRIRAQDAKPMNTELFARDCPDNCRDTAFDVDLMGTPLTELSLAMHLPKNWKQIQSKKLERFSKTSKHLPADSYSFRIEQKRLHVQFLAFYQMIARKIFLDHNGSLPCFSDHRFSPILSCILGYGDKRSEIDEIFTELEGLLNIIELKRVPIDEGIKDALGIRSLLSKLNATNGTSFRNDKIETIQMVHEEMTRILKCKEKMENTSKTEWMEPCPKPSGVFSHWKKTRDKFGSAKQAYATLFPWWKETFHYLKAFDRFHEGFLNRDEDVTELDIARVYGDGGGTRAYKQIEHLWTRFSSSKHDFLRYQGEFSSDNRERAAEPGSLYELLATEIRHIIDVKNYNLLFHAFPELHQTFEALNVTEKEAKNLDFLSSTWMKEFDKMLQKVSEFTPGMTYNKKNLILLNVYFRDLSLQIMTQMDAFTVWSLLAELGGTCGLYIGATLVTMCEVLLFICEAKGWIVLSEPSAPIPTSKSMAQWSKRDLYKVSTQSAISMERIRVFDESVAEFDQLKQRLERLESGGHGSDVRANFSLGGATLTRY